MKNTNKNVASLEQISKVMEYKNLRKLVEKLRNETKNNMLKAIQSFMVENGYTSKENAISRANLLKAFNNEISVSSLAGLQYNNDFLNVVYKKRTAILAEIDKDGNLVTDGIKAKKNVEETFYYFDKNNRHDSDEDEDEVDDYED